MALSLVNVFIRMRVTYHSASTLAHDSSQVEQDREDKNQPYRYSDLM